MKKIFSLHSAVFLSAFLLFQIELIISKLFLPQFGGSYLVWGACIVFFQAVLLLGYLYSHYVVQKWGIWRYRYFHLALLFLPLLTFPGRPLSAIYSHPQIPLVIDVFLQLLGVIGAVFFALSTTSVILQSWLAESDLAESKNPYILYAVSNLGSFVALFSYPFFFEGLWDLSAQLLIWRIGYLVLLAMHLITFRLVNVKNEPNEEDKKQLPSNIDTKEKIRWLLFGAGGVVMFLSVTNMITYEVAPIPLLWVIPLSIYLISFVLVFKDKPFCPLWVREKFHVTAGLSILLFFSIQKRLLPFLIEAAGLYISLFAICMFCQDALYRGKPKDSRNLPIFYVFISAGGFLGGILVSWIAPIALPSMTEYLVGLFLISVALAIGEKRKGIGMPNVRLITYIAIMLTFWPVKFQDYNVFGIIFIVWIFIYAYSRLKTKPRAFYLSVLSVLFLSYFMESPWDRHIPVYLHRNFYGIYKIYDAGGVRFLMHGSTIHGAQYLREDKQREALAYYHRASGVGELLTTEFFHFQNIAAVGLGTGTVATYLDTGQKMDFFEIDPDIYRIATQYFTFLKNTSGKIKVIFGDARLSLNKISGKRYDLIIIDAFSGDSIPIHLLTTDALAQYRKHLNTKGIILLHTSNRYLELNPILFSNACTLNAYACNKEVPQPEKGPYSASRWVALTWDQETFERLTLKLKWNKADCQRALKFYRAWSDRYSNLTPLIKLKGLLANIKYFQPLYW
jgi:spermidine synthase